MLRKLDGTENDDEAAIFGGKGSNLRFALKAGLLVPETFVLLPSAYHSCLEANDISFDIEELVRKFIGNRESLLDELDKIQNRIKVMNFELGKVGENFQLRELDKLLSSQTMVRSSALMEDSKKHSFAGCYRSFGGAVSREDLSRDIRRCWASSVSLNVIGYLACHRLTPVPGMAVLIQPLISTQKGGVCFTCDPRTGRSEHLYIEAVPGMASGVVDGTLSVERYLLSRNGLRVIDHQLNSKENQNGSLLDEDDISAICLAALRLEKFMGCRIDMEWGVFQGCLYIFQVRAVTTAWINEGSYENC